MAHLYARTKDIDNIQSARLTELDARTKGAVHSQRLEHLDSQTKAVEELQSARLAELDTRTKADVR